MSTHFEQYAVLIVDDDESVHDYLRLILEKAGHKVVSAGDGQSALDYLENATVDIILLDLQMPVLDGWQTAALLTAHETLRAIPIVVLSSLENEAPAGVAASLLKPDGLGAVLGTIERLLRRDRRQSPRYRAQFDLVAKASPGMINATTCDVSSGGVSFEVVTPPRIGERMILSVGLAIHGVARVEAEIRHVVAVQDAWRVGAAFVAFRHNAAGFAEELALLASSTPSL